MILSLNARCFPRILLITFFLAHSLPLPAWYGAARRAAWAPRQSASHSSFYSLRRTNDFFESSEVIILSLFGDKMEEKSN